MGRARILASVMASGLLGVCSETQNEAFGVGSVALGSHAVAAFDGIAALRAGMAGLREVRR